MKCEICGVKIPKGGEMNKNGQTMCEDCYLDTVAQPKTCDPWAVYSAKNLSGKNSALTDNQQHILDLLAEKGGCISYEEAASVLDMKPADVETELAVLRHMEKVHGRLENGKKLICLWEQS